MSESNNNKYTLTETEKQFNYFKHGRNITDQEKEIIFKKLETRIRDQGIFEWVQCPLWRYRLYKVINSNLIDGHTLNRIMKYVLEGDRLE